MKKQEEMRHSILSQVLDQQARARLNTIAIAKPEKAKMVENMLIRMAQTGQIQGKVDIDDLSIQTYFTVTTFYIIIFHIVKGMLI